LLFLGPSGTESGSGLVRPPTLNGRLYGTLGTAAASPESDGGSADGSLVDRDDGDPLGNRDHDDDDDDEDDDAANNNGAQMDLDLDPSLVSDDGGDADKHGKKSTNGKGGGLCLCLGFCSDLNAGLCLAQGPEGKRSRPTATSPSS